MWGDFVIEARVPIYMKWWAWVIIFLTTAFIVNFTDRHAPTYEEAKIHVNINVASHDDSDDYEKIAPVMATIDADETQNNTTDYNTPVTFLIGTQIPVGEYFVMSGELELGYILLTRSRNLDISEIIWQKHFENHTIINLREGEYLTTKNATLIPIDDAIVPNFENGRLTSGTYRVGIDIPPGVYTLFPLENRIGYFSTATSSHHLNAHITQHRNFSEPITIALNIGDYFSFMRAEIRK